jgi:hypothetical protein
MKHVLVCLMIPLVCLQTLSARVARAGGGQQVAVGNRSNFNQTRNTGANRNYNNNANVNHTGNYNNNANVNHTANYNNNANVNRNVNVNQNVNVNRNVNVNNNVDVHGGYYGGCCYHTDNDWNWGSFAAGAAVGVATTAAVAAATRPATTTVIAAPAVGSVVTALPGGCSTVSTGGAVIYHCSSIYYRPYYQGTTLVYQVVTYP